MSLDMGMSDSGSAESVEMGAVGESGHGVFEGVTMDAERVSYEGGVQNQILTTIDSDCQAEAFANEALSEINAACDKRGWGESSVISVKVDSWESGELGSYCDGDIRVTNVTDMVNKTTVAHELLHSRSFGSSWTEVSSDGRLAVHHDMCGLDDSVSAYDLESGSLVAELRENELLNEGLTVSYARDALRDSEMLGDGVRESFGYEKAAEVANVLRDTFGEEVDGAYFNGNLQGLRDAVDGASLSGTLDEISTNLDMVADETLSTAERQRCADRAMELALGLKAGRA